MTTEDRLRELAPHGITRGGGVALEMRLYRNLLKFDSISSCLHNLTTARLTCNLRYLLWQLEEKH